jgi:hypothetical protein
MERVPREKIALIFGLPNIFEKTIAHRRLGGGLSHIGLAITTPRPQLNQAPQEAKTFQNP